MVNYICYAHTESSICKSNADCGTESPPFACASAKSFAPTVTKGTALVVTGGITPVWYMGSSAVIRPGIGAFLGFMVPVALHTDVFEGTDDPLAALPAPFETDGRRGVVLSFFAEVFW